MQTQDKVNIQTRCIPFGDPVHPHPLLDRIYRTRGVSSVTQLDYHLKSLPSPNLFNGMNIATELLITARVQQQRIIIVGDFDSDGATSTALAVKALQQLGFQQVDYLIPDRFEHGYGLSPAIAQMALDRQVELLITVDNGIASFEGVALLKEQGVNVMITDHHLPSEKLPQADCIINPNLIDCTFPSKNLAGVGVIFYVMLALRSQLRDRGFISAENAPNFAQLLDLVALGTVADVVPLDHINRLLVHQGLARIKAEHCCIGMKALIEVAQRHCQNLTVSDLGFALAPRLNATGRLENMKLGVQLLLSNNLTQARKIALELDELNQVRKEIEQGMKAEALQICQKLIAQSDNKSRIPMGIALYQPDWHPGVLGIVAARIKDHYHRPVIAFAQDQPGILKGSARSIHELHIRDLLEELCQQQPNMIIQFGGHAMAAGLSINEHQFESFQCAFNQLVNEKFHDNPPTPQILTDGELKVDEFNLETALLIAQAGPWGQTFPVPCFSGKFHILQQRIVGEKHLKLLLEPLQGGVMLDGIVFNVNLSLFPDFSIKCVQLVYQLEINEFRGVKNIQLLINHIEPC